jgi:hypothetical protein
MLKQYHLLKGHNQMQLNQIQVSVNKTQLTGIIADILASENNTALLRAITPHLAGSFPQFPAFTNVSVDSINEDGSANVTLKVPRITTANSTESDEPTTVDEVDMSEPTFDN